MVDNLSIEDRIKRIEFKISAKIVHQFRIPWNVWSDPIPSFELELIVVLLIVDRVAKHIIERNEKRNSKLVEWWPNVGNQFKWGNALVERDENLHWLRAVCPYSNPPNLPIIIIIMTIVEALWIGKVADFHSNLFGVRIVYCALGHTQWTGWMAIS